MRTKTLDDKEQNVWLTIIKGSLLALSVSLILVLVFAFAIKYIAIPNETIRPINQVIKGISIFIGTFLTLKKVKQMGLISGLLIGLLYTLLAFLIFSLLDGNFEFSLLVVNDLLFGGIIGGICGVMAVNLLKK